MKIYASKKANSEYRYLRNHGLKEGFIMINKNGGRLAIIDQLSNQESENMFKVKLPINRRIR